jgi:hypothetical protein
VAKLNIRTLNGIRSAQQPSGRDVAEAFDDVAAALGKLAATSVPQSGPAQPTSQSTGTTQTPTKTVAPPGQPAPTNGLQGVTSFTGDGTVLANSASSGSVVAALEAVVPNAFLGGPEFGSTSELPTYRYIETPDLPYGGTWDFMGILSGNFDITGNFSILAELLDATSSAGASGALLSSTGSGVRWTQNLAPSEILFNAASGAPTSAGTAGTAGQIIYYGGNLYFCSVTGAAGAATWNRVNLTAV